MGSQRCNSFFRNKGKRKGLLSRLLAIYEMFCLCETYRESGSVPNLLISHIPLEGITCHVPLQVEIVHKCITTHCFSGLYTLLISIWIDSLMWQIGVKIGKEGEAEVCRGAIGWWAHLKE